MLKRLKQVCRTMDSVADLCDGWAPAVLVGLRMVRPVTNEELPARHTAILSCEFSTAAHIKQAHLAASHCYLRQSDMLPVQLPVF